MTEHEWSTSTDPGAMLRSVIARYSAQSKNWQCPSFEKLRLFACADDALFNSPEWHIEELERRIASADATLIVERNF